jgi:hypothetical protein
VPQQVGHALAGLGRDPQHLLGRHAQDLLDLAGDPVGLGGRQVDLVDHRDDGQVGLDGQVEVGQGLGLDPLGGVDQQHRPLAGGQGPRHLVGEVDVAGGVDQVEDVLAAVGGGVGQPDGLGLDGDAALALQVHLVEVLGAHVPLAHRMGEVEQPVGQGGLPVVDVGDDAEVAQA